MSSNVCRSMREAAFFSPPPVNCPGMSTRLKGACWEQISHAASQTPDDAQEACTKSLNRQEMYEHGDVTPYRKMI